MPQSRKQKYTAIVTGTTIPITKPSCGSLAFELCVETRFLAGTRKESCVLLLLQAMIDPGQNTDVPKQTVSKCFVCIFSFCVVQMKLKLGLSLFYLNRLLNVCMGVLLEIHCSQSSPYCYYQTQVAILINTSFIVYTRYSSNYMKCQIFS